MNILALYNWCQFTTVYVLCKHSINWIYSRHVTDAANKKPKNFGCLGFCWYVGKHICKLGTLLKYVEIFNISRIIKDIYILNICTVE